MIEKSIREMQNSQEKAYQTEKKYFELMVQLLDARHDLLLKQAKLLREGKLSIKQPDLREVQLVTYAKKEYTEVKELEKAVYAAQAEYLSAKRSWESWQAICLLQSGV